ncbi:acyl-CoA carboxylase subunit epsilon [Streptomyces actuosus]|uniref:Acyl-CoA carboxylase subunit epsilon n=1 Tax=Streptomyces actuosus TaxID=1885 RepID=A0ABS2VZX3_STRAS|nr:acyl-CoA carboxylase epsilon subunit [Streptomyces actuosus]MBN0048578.1 acyl-CoA carboxylase subunit epsilon [Streptomyces actuosus]
MNRSENAALVRVERGVAGEEELAALAAVLLARAAVARGHCPDAGPPPRPVARWNGLEPRRSYQSPVSWQAVT